MNRQMLFLILILGIFIYFGFMQAGSVVSIGTIINGYPSRLPLQTGTFNFAGYSGTYETPYLGSVSCSGKSDSYICYAGGSNPLGDNTGFSNSLQDGQTLRLKSSANSDNAHFENYIKTKITLPKGTLKVNYDYSVFHRYPCQPSMIIFKIDGISKGFNPGCGSGKDWSKKDSGSFEVVLDNEQEIEFSVITHNSDGGDFSISGTMTIKFEELEEETEEEEYLPPSEAEDEIEPSTQELTFIEKINQSINQFFEGIISWFKNLF